MRKTFQTGLDKAAEKAGAEKAGADKGAGGGTPDKGVAARKSGSGGKRR